MRRAFLLLRVLGGAAALAAILWHVDITSVRVALTEAAPTWIAAALSVNLIAVLLSAMLWRATMTAPRPPLLFAWKAYAAGTFLNNVGVGTAIGDAYRAQMLRGRDVGASKAIVSVGIERVASLCALLLLACIGAIIISPHRPELAFAVLAGSGFATFAMAAAAVLAGRVGGASRLPAALRAQLTDGVEVVASFARGRPVLVRVTVLATLVQLCTVFATFALVRSLGVNITVTQSLTVVPIIALAVLLPISIQGVGVRETAYVTLLGSVGVSAEHALAAALLSYLTTVLVSLVGGAVLASDILAARSAPSRPATTRPSALSR